MWHHNRITRKNMPTWNRFDIVLAGEVDFTDMYEFLTERGHTFRLKTKGGEVKTYTTECGTLHLGYYLIIDGYVLFLEMLSPLHDRLAMEFKIRYC